MLLRAPLISLTEINLKILLKYILIGFTNNMIIPLYITESVLLEDTSPKAPSRLLATENRKETELLYI